MNDHLSESKTVVLGPMVEFHSGIHGALVDQPPPGIEYVASKGRVHYWHENTAGWSPLGDMAIDEVVELAPSRPTARYVVHSSRVPVHGAVPWLADADCLLATAMYGRDYLFGLGERAPVEAKDHVMRARVEHLVRRYLAPECFGVLFHTAWFRNVFLAHVDESGLFTGPEQEALERRCRVVIPAVGVPELAPRRCKRTRILYSARAGVHKGAAIAAEVFRELHRLHGDAVELHWLGEAAPTEMSEIATFTPLLDRAGYLEFLATCDLYFAPSTSESLGMAMLEASAYGALVVTGQAAGLPHLDELFTDGVDSVVVDRGVEAQRVNDYVRRIGNLIGRGFGRQDLVNEARRRSVARFATRNQRLTERYETMFDHFDEVSLRGAQLPADGPMLEAAVSKTSIDLQLIQAVLTKRGKNESRNLNFANDGMRPVDR